ncbi:MAG: hypothetical protein A3J51_03265 [Omnitrophica WOR_2 bacterium RIFCSPHIGHO2_02_FULL_45_21]|nr:MAG: hypothetical protein A3J51_03265 [Omnitrophica WOR_2 bacterium RIFCSPHIGHO2_02_FULL_45_21]
MRKKILIVSVIAVLVFGFNYFVYSQNERKKRNELYKQLELFSDGLSLVEAEFVDAPKSRDLIYGALKGMLSSLDPYSEFLDPESRKELEVGTEGEFGGLGIEITIKDELLTVITPIEDTPAWKAGLKSGDRIVKINAELTRNITASEAVKKLRGKPGTEVALTILREDKSGGQGRFFEVKITRDIIKVKDIKNTSILEDNIGYIRLVEFRKNTPADLDTALAQLKKSGMDGLILDLRNNPGGLLDVAVKTVDRFIPTGKVVVSTKGRLASQDMEYKSANGAKYLDIPMVLIVNEGSASGSEIVAGALQDYKRAVLIGTKTFGKGAVQSVLPLSDGSALKLTTSKWFTPGGRLIHTQGIIPDIVVEAGRSPSGDKLDSSAGPAEVEKVFENLKEKAQGVEKEQPVSFEEFDYKKDNQIVRAIDIIKGIKVYKAIQP